MSDTPLSSTTLSDSTNRPVIYLGADHGGFSNKVALQAWLAEQGYAVEDCGAFQLDPQDDYPKFAAAVAEKVVTHSANGTTAGEIGILLCRSGAGMVMAANRFPSIRAVAVMNVEQAAHARAHNDANVIALSGDWMDLELMKACISVFLQTPFSGDERHQRRLRQLDTLVS